MITRNITIAFIFSLLFLACSSAPEQNNKEDNDASNTIASYKEEQQFRNLEKQVAYYLKAITYWKFWYNEKDTSFTSEVSYYDSITTYNQLLKDYLINAINTMPKLITANLDKLSELDIMITTSPDKKVRIYSWDTHMGGTMHIFNSVLQHTTHNGTKGYLIESSEGVNPYYGAIYLVKGHEQNFYLNTYLGILSNRYSMQGIRAFMIEDDSIKSANIFHTPSKTYNDINLYYDVTTNHNDNRLEENFIRLSKNNDTLYIPIVDDESMTNKSLVCIFDGEKFLFNKDAE